MNEKNNPWDKLARLARQAPEPAPAETPFGFATRVVANWPSSPALDPSTIWELLSVRSLVLAALIMAITLGINYDLVSHDWTQEVAVADATFEPLLQP